VLDVSNTVIAPASPLTSFVANGGVKYATPECIELAK
jgi:hypothetical protein